MDNPSITIIIPVKDQLEELRNCLHSISQQDSLNNIDVIVIDDGSQEPIDRSCSSETFPFAIRFFRQPSSGVSAARNHGIQQSRGDYLLFMDSDCEMAEESLSNHLETANRVEM